MMAGTQITLMDLALHQPDIFQWVKQELWHVSIKLYHLKRLLTWLYCFHSILHSITVHKLLSIIYPKVEFRFRKSKTPIELPWLTRRNNRETSGRSKKFMAPVLLRGQSGKSGAYGKGWKRNMDIVTIIPNANN